MTSKDMRFCAILAAVLPAMAQSAAVLEGGRVNIKGELINGGCAVAPESQHLRVEMGQYRIKTFSGPGSFSTVNVPFTLRLVDCNTAVSSTLAVMFEGATPSEDPQVFLATSRPGESPVSSGVGLAIFDSRQRQIVPNTPAEFQHALNSGENLLHFSARYRAISEHLTPGVIQSDVWFTLIYP